MKRGAVVITTVLFFGVVLAGCGKKDTESLSGPVSELSMSSMSSLPAEGTAAVTGAEKQSLSPKSEVAVEPAALGPVGQEALPPQGPYKPSTTEIQNALKAAGFYTGTVDGKAGPKTQKAIEDFQKANNLKVDGKIGPQSWGLLSGYLTSGAPVEAPKKVSKNRKN